MGPLVPPPETQSFILIADDGTTPRLSAHPRADLSQPGGLTVELAPDAQLHVLTYADPLERLGLTAGPLELQPSAACPLQVARPLPEPNQIYTTTLEHFAGAPWVNAPQLPAPLQALRLAPLDAVHCTSNNYCVRPGLDRCSSNCPMPEPVMPVLAPPAAPFPPKACDGDCDWTPLACEGGFWRPGGCTVFAPCPSEPFPPPRPGVWWVGTQGSGDGSFERPFGSLAQAVAAVPQGATLILSQGDHAATFLEKSLVLQGTCVGGTRIVGNFEIHSAEVTLTELSLQGQILANTATLTVRRARVLDPEQIALESRGGRLNLQDVSLQGGTTGISLKDATATISTTSFEAQTEFGILVQRSQLTAEQLSFRDTGLQDASLQLEEHSGAVLRRIAWHNNVGPALRAFFSELTLTDGWIQQPASRPTVELVEGTYTFERLYLEQVAPAMAINGSMAEVSFTDLEVKADPSQGALGLLNCNLQLTRFRAEGVFDRAFDLAMGNGTISDVFISQPPGLDDDSVSLRGATGSLTRVQIEGGGRSFDLRGATAVRIEDLIVRGGTERVIDLATDIEVERTTTVERALLVDVVDAFWLEEGSLEVRDVVVRGAKTGVALQPRTGAEVFTFKLTRGRIEDSAVGLIVLPNPLGAYAPLLRDLEIVRATNAALLTPCLIDEAELLEEVLLTDSGPILRK